MDDDITFVSLADTDAFNAFVVNNRDLILDQIGSIERAYELACNQCLILAGGAAPLVRVGFED